MLLPRKLIMTFGVSHLTFGAKMYPDIIGPGSILKVKWPTSDNIRRRAKFDKSNIS